MSDAPKTPGFEDLWSEATAWTELHERRVFQNGRSLDQTELALAKSAGVKLPENIRLYVVDVVPVPKDGLLGQFAANAGWSLGDWQGLTVNYGVYVRKDRVGTTTVPHEFRHVAQYECFGSVKNFAFFYLRELLFFGYGNGPLERDAKLSESILNR